MRTKLKNLLDNTKARAAATGTALMVAAGSAMAAGTGPGDAMAGEIATGRAQQMVVISAVAICLGVLIVWSLVKRAK